MRKKTSMNSQISLIVLVYFLLVLKQLSYCLRWSGIIKKIFNPYLILSLGTQLFDLEGTGTSFENQANLWSAINLADGTTKHSVCGGTYLLGGFGILTPSGSQTGDYFQRVFSSLPSHNMILVSLIFFKIDSWDQNSQDHVKFIFDSVQLKTWYLPVTGLNQVDVCGSSIYPDLDNIKIQMLVPHKGSTLVMKVEANLNEPSDNESFGFRDLILEFVNSADPQAELCGVTTAPLPDRLCNCSVFNQYYIDVINTCSGCDSNCALCNGPTSNDCVACHVGKYINQNHECVDCTSPCATCEGASTYCKTCISGYFLVENNTCIPTCDPPLIQTSDGIVMFCESPCGIGQYAYPNGSCSLTCDPFLSEITIHNYKLCKPPCTSNEIYYYNRSCFPTCNLPFTLMDYGGYYVCDYICVFDEYLYPNGTCKIACKAPYKPILRGGKRFCELICDPIKYFLTPNYTCLLSCPLRFYSQENPKVCERCADSLCLRCPLQSGKICQECQENTILDLDETCKICNSMKIRYIRTFSNNQHQYRIELFPPSCDLDVEIIKRNLIGFNKLSANSSIQTKKLNHTSYLLNIILTESVLEEIELELTLHYLKGVVIIPKTLVPNSDIEKLTEYAPATQKAMTYVTASTMGGALVVGATAILWPMINFQQFVGYFIYINIDYPLQVELFLSLFTFSNFSFIPNPIAPLTDDLQAEFFSSKDIDLVETHEAPKKFRKYEETSFFAENGSSALLSNIAFLLLLALISTFIQYYRRKQLPFFKIIHFNFRWNFIMRSFLENGIPLSLATFLQLRKLSFENKYTAICAFLAIISFFYLVIMVHFLINTLLDTSWTYLKQSKVIKLYGTLYEGINAESQAGKYYHILILFRGTLLVFLVSFSEISPLLQIIPLMIVNLGLIYALFRETFFENPKLNIINRAKEILILFGEVCILLLYFDSKSEVFVQILGWSIIISLGSVVFIDLTYLIIVEIISLKPLFNKIKFMYRYFCFEYVKSSRIKKKLQKDSRTKKEIKKSFEDKKEAGSKNFE